jgi:hypothetical protein
LVVCAGVANAPPTLADAILFISDNSSGVIQAFDFSTATPAYSDISLSLVTGIAIGPGGDLFAAGDLGGGPHVFRYDENTGAAVGGPYVTYQSGVPDDHDVFGPQGMAFHPGGNLYVADVTQSNVHVYGSMDDSLDILTSMDLTQPRDVAFDAAGNMYTVSGTAQVLRADGGTAPVYSLFPPTTGGLIDPSRITVGPDGKLYVLDLTTSTGPAIRRYAYNSMSSMWDADGDFVSYASVLFDPADLEFGPDGKLYVAGLDLNMGVGQVLRYLPDGTPDGIYLSGLQSPAFMTFSPIPEVSSAVLVFAAGGLTLAACFLRRIWRAS